MSHQSAYQQSMALNRVGYISERADVMVMLVEPRRGANPNDANLPAREGDLWTIPIQSAKRDVVTKKHVHRPSFRDLISCFDW